MKRVLAYFQTAHVSVEISCADVAGLMVPYRVGIRMNEACKLGVASVLCSAAIAGSIALMVLA